MRLILMTFTTMKKQNCHRLSLASSAYGKFTMGMARWRSNFSRTTVLNETFLFPLRILQPLSKYVPSRLWCPMGLLQRGWDSLPTLCCTSFTFEKCGGEPLMCIIMPLASDFITIVQTCPLWHGSFAIIVNMCYTHLSIKPNPNPKLRQNGKFGV